MKYTRQTLKYIFGNFWYLILFGLFPAVFLAFSLDIETVGSVLREFFTGNPYAAFADIFHSVSIFNFHSPLAVLFQCLGLVLVVLCAAMTTAFIEKHMRIGKRTWNGLFSKLNDNFLSTFGFTLLLALVYEIWALIVSALLYYLTFIGSKAVVYVLAGAVFFGTQAILLYVVSTFYLWLPCLQITGFRSFEALRYSYQLVAPVKGKIIGAQFVSMLIAEVALGEACMFIPVKGVAFAIAAVIFAGEILVFVTRMQVAYFDCAQIERADLKPYFSR